MTETGERGEHSQVPLDKIQQLAQRVQVDPTSAEKFKQVPQATLEAAGFSNAFKAKIATDDDGAQEMVPIPDSWCFRWGETYVCSPYWF